jgi:hypothetical protein
MDIAYHFDVDMLSAQFPKTLYNFPVLEKLFRSLLSMNFNNLNLKIFEGDLLVDQYVVVNQYISASAVNSTTEDILGTKFRTWQGIDAKRLKKTILSSPIFVVLLEGLSPHVRDYLNDIFKRERSYIGAIEILAANPIQWKLYKQSLSPHYRYINKELRIFYMMGEEDTKDDGLEAKWKELPFHAVRWENLNARHTIFDIYADFDHSVLVSELNEILSSRLAQLAEDILLRLGDLDPRLQSILYAAFKAFYSVQTSEEIAQIAISCRRFIEGLANTLYPPKEESIKGRNLGPEAYRNRLWAYVEERLDASKQTRDLVKTGLQDLGSRIDKIDTLANKGLHADITLVEIDRLLIALVTVTYDLLSLAPPPLEVPIEPHLPEFDKFFEEIKKEIQNDDENPS